MLLKTTANLEFSENHSYYGVNHKDHLNLWFPVNISGKVLIYSGFETQKSLQTHDFSEIFSETTCRPVMFPLKWQSIYHKMSCFLDYYCTLYGTKNK